MLKLDFWRRAPSSADEALAARLDRKIRLSRLAFAWERIWPALWPPLGVLGLIIVTALFGLWGYLPSWLHIIALAAALIGLGVALVPLRHLRWPTREEARERLDLGSPTRHRPATGFEDRLAGAPGAATVALWEAHRRRLAREAAGLEVRRPRPRLLQRDPLALRAALGIALAVGIVYAGPDWRERVADAFMPIEPAPEEPLRLDAWITPPPYTGKPPVFLVDGSDPLSTARAPETPIEIPAGSALVLRFHGERTAEAMLAPADGGSPQTFAYDGTADAPEIKAPLDGDATLTVERPGADGPLVWTLDALPDRRPEIALAEEITTTEDQAMRLVYSVKDDYGVIAADARFEQTATADRPTEAEGSSGLRLEVAPPDFALVLPGVRVREAQKEMFRDLTAHPWAGLEVRITLAARDEAGQEGLSDPVVITLPERRFINPLARAVIEQRRDLVRAPETRERVARALNALTIAPERFIDDLTVYLGLRTAYLRTLDIASNEDLAETVALLWDVALRIEDGDLSLAERELRAAQEELARALAEGASDEEIERLMDELREALSRFMEAMREQAQRMGELPPIDGQMLESHDLSQMMDMIEELAKSGARDAAQQLLSQLQNLLENLQGMAGMQMSPEQSLMSETLEELGRMIGEQQRLMDETYRQGQQQGEGGEQAGQMPMPGQSGRQGELGQSGRSSPGGRMLGEGEGQPGPQGELGPSGGPSNSMSLADEQRALREQLEALTDQLLQGGIDTPSPLGRAGEEMGEAEADLRADDNNSAVSDQREALDQLRQGAQSMAQQLAEGMAPGAGPGQPGPSSRNGLTDPLGRPMRSTGPEFGLSVKVPDEIDAETARRLREELQRRLGDQFRRSLELDYIERLLDLF